MWLVCIASAAFRSDPNEPKGVPSKSNIWTFIDGSKVQEEISICGVVLTYSSLRVDWEMSENPVLVAASSNGISSRGWVLVVATYRPFSDGFQWSRYDCSTIANSYLVNASRSWASLIDKLKPGWTSLKEVSKFLAGWSTEYVKDSGDKVRTIEYNLCVVFNHRSELPKSRWLRKRVAWSIVDLIYKSSPSLEAISYIPDCKFSEGKGPFVPKDIPSGTIISPFGDI